MKKLTPFGKAVRILRAERGQTQLDVSDALGVSIAFWSAIETGKKNIPDDLLVKVINHFNLTDADADKLRELSMASQQEVKINMQNLDDRSRQLVVGFARKFSSLDSDVQQKLRDLLDLGDD
jgi:HTH-type transcriptional regulator, competence development regulator